MYGITFWNRKDKHTRKRVRYELTYTTKQKAQGECLAFFCPWELARAVKIKLQPKPLVVSVFVEGEGKTRLAKRSSI